MAACALLGDINGDHVSGNGSNNKSQSPSLNSNSQGSSVEQNPGRSKMVRKRMASEIEVNNNSLRSSSNNNNGGDNYMRISRNRSVMLNPNPTHDGSNKLVNMVSNYSTTMLNLPSSTNLTTLMTSGGGVLSTASPSSSSSHPSWGPIDPLSLHHPIHTQTQIATTPPPAVCGFSGLPLFPPERSTTTSSPGVAPPASILSMDQDSSATAWIDLS